MGQERDIEAVTGPTAGAAQETPQGLLKRQDLDRAVKVATLRQWEQELRERQVAEDESMAAAAPPAFTLEDVLEALHALGEGPQDHPVPTSHG